MKSPTPEEITEKSLSAKSDVDSEVRDSVEQESSKPVQTAHSKLGIDAERIRSSIAKLTSSSTNELEKLITEFEALQEFLKSETGRVQHEIGNVLAGIGLIIEAIGLWTPSGAGSVHNTRANAVSNGRDKLKRWP
jgi:histidinol dehydrogenase